MRSDFHLHSSFSADSDAPMRDMVEKGISLGLSAMCFTEHMDYDYIDEGMVFEADIPSYCKTLTSLKEEYEHKIELLFGLELGLQPYLKERCESLVKNWDFDFVIGSSHVVNGQDPYYPAFFEGRTEKESYISYFESIIENLQPCPALMSTAILIMSSATVQIKISSILIKNTVTGWMRSSVF